MTELPKTAGNISKRTGESPQKNISSGGAVSPDNFTMAEMALGIMYTLTTDTICLILDYTVIGAFISPAIRNGVAFTIWLWLKSKNDPHVKKMGRWIARGAGNFVPWIPLFINTFMFIADVYIHNHPEKFAIVEKVAGATQGKV